MENRFGLKDLIYAGLLLAVLVLIVLAMFQYDRQWEQLVQINKQANDQAASMQRLYQDQQQFLGRAEEQQRKVQEELSAIRGLLERGVAVRPPPPPPEGGNGPPREIRPAPGAQVPPLASTAPAGTAADLLPPEGQDIDPMAPIKKARAMPGYIVGDQLVRSFGVLPPKLTPLVSQDAYGAAIQALVLDSLADRDPRTLDWRPVLAQYWQRSRDGLRVEFQLRRGVVFADGQPLTADDVVFSYQWLMNPQVECPASKVYYEKVKAVEKMNDYRVAFTFSEPYFKAFEMAAGLSILPRHFYADVSPTDFNAATGLLLGSGPYRLPDPRGWRPEPGKPIELVRNERYWGQRPVFDRLIYQIITNEVARLTTFRNGKLDAFGPTPEQHLDMLKDPDLVAHTGHYEFVTPDEGYLYIGWNQKRGDHPTRFADKRVRQAMTMLTDRQRVLNEVFAGYGRVPSGPFSALSPQSDPKVEPWPFDAPRARELLKEVGYEMKNGLLTGPDGQPFSFKLSYPSGSATFERVVLFLKDTYAQGGVEMVPDPLEWSVLLERINQHDFDAVSLGWTGAIEDDPYQIFHSSQITPPGSNSISYNSAEADHLIEEGRRTMDEAQRMLIWHRLHRVLHEDQPYTFLLVRTELYWTDNRFQNVEMTKLGPNSILEWWVPADRRRWTP